MRSIVTGLVFAALWASASAATKFGLMSGQPLVIANVRFFIAGLVMLAFSRIIHKSILPKRGEWKPLMIYGALNVTIYLGCFVLAMRELSAGIGSLSTALAPLIISVISAIWMKRPIRRNEISGLVFGIIGVAVATYPLLMGSYVTLRGLLIMALSMLSYSFGTVYYVQINWKMPRLSINTWQIIFGGLFLLPFTFISYHATRNHYDLRFWASVFWLVLPVSVIAVQLWLFMVREDAVQASTWLFLCPIFGFVFAFFLLNEPITVYTFAGTALVIAGLYMAQKKPVQKAEVLNAD